MGSEMCIRDRWKECLDSDTYLQGKGSTVARVTDGSLFFHPLTAISGVANIGDDTNWCGHPFAQANWYAFGRLAWKHSLSSEQIGEEWLKQTFLPVTGAQTDTPAGEVIQKEQIDAQLSLLNSPLLLISDRFNRFDSHRTVSRCQSCQHT